MLGAALAAFASTMLLLSGRATSWFQPAVRAFIVLVWLSLWLGVLGITEPIDWGGWTHTPSIHR